MNQDFDSSEFEASRHQVGQQCVAEYASGQPDGFNSMRLRDFTRGIGESVRDRIVKHPCQVRAIEFASIQFVKHSMQQRAGIQFAMILWVSRQQAFAGGSPVRGMRQRFERLAGHRFIMVVVTHVEQGRGCVKQPAQTSARRRIKIVSQHIDNRVAQPGIGQAQRCKFMLPDCVSDQVEQP